MNLRELKQEFFMKNVIGHVHYHIMNLHDNDTREEIEEMARKVYDYMN